MYVPPWVWETGAKLGLSFLGNLLGGGGKDTENYRGYVGSQRQMSDYEMRRRKLRDAQMDKLRLPYLSKIGQLLNETTPFSTAKYMNRLQADTRNPYLGTGEAPPPLTTAPFTFGFNKPGTTEYNYFNWTQEDIDEAARDQWLEWQDKTGGDIGFEEWKKKYFDPESIFNIPGTGDINPKVSGGGGDGGGSGDGDGGGGGGNTYTGPGYYGYQNPGQKASYTTPGGEFTWLPETSKSALGWLSQQAYGKMNRPTVPFKRPQGTDIQKFFNKALNNAQFRRPVQGGILPLPSRGYRRPPGAKYPPV